jgi:hypothetical protein
MVGQIQILAYMLAVYLVYKGYEIFHIALLSTSDKKKLGMILGGLALVGSIVFAALFVWMMDEQAGKVGNNYLK